MESPIMDDDKEHDNKETAASVQNVYQVKWQSILHIYPCPLLLVQKLLKNQRQPLKIKMQILSLDLFHVKNAGIQNYM